MIQQMEYELGDAYFFQTLIQKQLLQRTLHCSAPTLTPNWMPLILYEQREGPSWCGSSNGPSSGSHIDKSLCEDWLRMRHHTKGNLTQVEEKLKKIRVDL